MTEQLEISTTIRSALAHLDDPVYLETHPLAQEIPFLAQASAVSRGQLLRRMLRLAIESLDPGPHVPLDSPAAQCYQVLYRYAIAKQSIISIAMQLGMSERQAYRMLEKGTKAIAEILLSTRQEASTPAENGLSQPAIRLRDEIERLAVVGERRFSLSELVEEIMQVVRPLAERSGILLHLETPRFGEDCVVANRVMLRQTLINLLSHALRYHRGADLTLRVQATTNSLEIVLCYRPLDGEDLESEGPYTAVQQLLSSLKLTSRRQTLEDGWIRWALSLGVAADRTVLVIDDNEGLITLFRRYLQGEPYRVYGAKSIQEALTIIDELRPHIILLDIMMPDQDGWEGLQALRATEAGRQAKIIICSIINDPDLSAALGADSFLHKPVDRAQLLRTLARAASSEE